MDENNISFVAGLLREANGSPSSIRTMLFFCSGVIILAWAAMVIMNAIHGNYTLPSIPAPVLTFLGCLAGAKTVQKKFEEK